MKTIYLGKRFSIFQLSLTCSQHLNQQILYVLMLPKKKKKENNKYVQIRFAPNISSQYMIPLICINRYQHNVSRKKQKNSLFIHLMKAYLAVIIANYFSLFNIRLEKLDSFKKTKSKQAVAVFIEPVLSVNETKWFATLIEWKLCFMKGNQRPLNH